MDELISAAKVSAKVKEMGQAIGDFYAGKPLTVVVLMNGGAFFGIDLARAIPLPLQFDSLRAASYTADRRGRFRLEAEPKLDPRGREILLADDVFDSGETIRHCREYFLKRGAAGVRCAVLINKRVEGRASEPEWAGFDAPDRYLVGCGMDSHEEYRALPFVGAI